MEGVVGKDGTEETTGEDTMGIKGELGTDTIGQGTGEDRQG